MSLRHPHLARRTFLVGGISVTAVGALGLPAHAAWAAAPSIYTTSDWEARAANGSIEVLDEAPTKIIVHHTATPNSSDTSKSHAFALSRQIQEFHMDSNGWTDTGQNFTNTRGGYKTEGRHKSLTALSGGSQHVVGAHAGEQNSVALGIENEGTYTEASVPDELWSSLAELCTYMVSQYGIDASAIYGHRDFMSTECPGDVLYGRLSELRKAVGAAVGQAVTDPITWPLLKPRAAGPRVTAAQHLLRAQGVGSVPVDGEFGPSTQAAADAFLASKRIPVASCYATRVEERGLLGGLAWTQLAPVLSADSRGDAVLAAQTLLTSKGRATPSDARFSTQTTTAVRDFQASNGLNPNGVVDHETWKRLLA